MNEQCVDWWLCGCENLDGLGTWSLARDWWLARARAISCCRATQQQQISGLDVMRCLATNADRHETERLDQ